MANSFWLGFWILIFEEDAAAVALVFEKIIIRLLKVCKLELEHGWLLEKENECEPPGKYSTKKLFLLLCFLACGLKNGKWKLISHQKRAPSIFIHNLTRFIKSFCNKYLPILNLNQSPKCPIFSFIQSHIYALNRLVTVWECLFLRV